jgi:RNA polymerase sigma factor (sigma-70 family)
LSGRGVKTVATLDPGLLPGLFDSLVIYFRHNLPSSLTSETEDLAQETLTATWSALQKGTITAGDPARYARGVARNQRAEAMRKLRRRPTVSLDQLPEESIAKLIVSAAADWALMQAETAESLRKAVNSLPPMELQFLRLRYVDGLDNHKASRMLGLAPEKGSRLRYIAIRRLRLLLGGGSPRKRLTALRAVR